MKKVIDYRKILNRLRLGIARLRNKVIFRGNWNLVYATHMVGVFCKIIGRQHIGTVKHPNKTI